MIFRGDEYWSNSLCFCDHHAYSFSVDCQFTFSMLPAQSLFHPCCKVVCTLVHLPSIWNIGHKSSKALLWKRVVKMDPPTPQGHGFHPQYSGLDGSFLSREKAKSKPKQTPTNQINKTPKRINRAKIKKNKN